ncbi:MAG TPA: fimbrial assembly protein, partial [Cellulomonas sp.]|nr:fimbrial assembly protein [Cellulomonas sp.]
MSTDVDWQTAIDQIAAVLPDTVSIDNYVVSGANPMTAPAAPSNPLQGESVGQIAFTLRAAEVVDTAPWIDAMNSLPGFQDAWFSAAGLASDDSGAYYAIQGTVQFTQDRYTNRFSATAADADEKG